jgi:hypothetical protein
MCNLTKREYSPLTAQNIKPMEWLFQVIDLLPWFCRSSQTRYRRYNPSGQRDRGTVYEGNCNLVARRSLASGHTVSR